MGNFFVYRIKNILQRVFNHLNRINSGKREQYSNKKVGYIFPFVFNRYKNNFMRSILVTMCLALPFFKSYGQDICDDAFINSFTMNTTEELADYQINCCPPTNTNTAVQLSDYAGVTEIWYNNNYGFIKSNSLAYYTMGPWDTEMWPSAQDITFKIPRTVTEDLSGTKNTAESGTIGVAVDGVSIFSETTSQSYNTSNDNHNGGDGVWNEDAWMDEAWSLDSSGNGHSNAGGKYHYHASPIKLYSGISNGHSPIIGWGLDGVPIYGPYGYSDSLDANSSVVRMETGYQLRNITDRTTLADGTVLTSDYYGPSISAYELGTYVEDYEHVVGLGHLDEHNGRWCVTPEYPSGIYAYFVTEDIVGTPVFPYFIGPEFYGETASGNTIPNNAEEFDPAGCTITNTDNPIQESAFSIYPNPASNQISLDFTQMKGQDFEVEIFNVNGQRVYNGILSKSGKETINLQLESGFYQLKVSSENAKATEVLIVK